MFTQIRSLLLVALLASAAAPAFAANEGQDDLDKATDTKLNATTISDLAEVIRLAESALNKGLDESNTEFANRLLASTLLQRSQETVKQIFTDGSSPADFRMKRQFALSDLSKSVKLDANQAEAYMLIAQLNLLPGGDIEQARDAIEKSLKLEFEEPADQAKAFLLRAGMETEPDKKMADLDEAVKLMPNDAAVIRARGLVLADLEKLEPALADLDKAIELDSDDSPTYEAKAIVLARLKRYDEALAALDKAKQLSPASVMPLLQQARVHSHQENLDAALEDLNQALKMDPKNAAVLLMRASLYQEKGDKDKAMEDVDQALKLKPDLPVAIRTRALLLAEREQFAEATVELQKLHKLDPKDTLTLLQLAMLYGAQKKTAEAIDTYTTLLAESPEEWRALRGRGDSYLNLGKQAEAIADFEKALALQPKDHGILNNLAWVLATSPDEKLRDGKRAIELATLACEVTEYKAAYILSTLAAAYAETGDFDTAIKWSTKAVEIDDNEHGEALKKELESYKAKKPWREAIPEDEPANKEAEKPAQNSEKPQPKP